ncbi:MAG: hypothetical protein FWD60_12790 [Candidatus Azobacteroides sp.]|nr:hypothetical protein [Candidatus Azobacteroides sp.]
MNYVYFDIAAEEAVGQFYENYQYNGNQQTDLEQRVNIYRKIKQVMFNLEHFIDQTFVKNSKNFIEIPDIAIIEYIENDKGWIIIKNIYFNNM